MDNFLVVYTAKADGVDQAAVKKAALKHYAGYYVRHINESEDEYEVHLAKLADRKSTRKREAAPPPFEKKDDAPTDDAEEESESPDEEAAEDSGDKPDDDAESKGDKPKGEGKGNPAAEAEKVMGELQKLFTDLGVHVKNLQDAHDEKDQKLKDITDVAAPDGAADMAEVPPMADMPSPEEIGPTPGKTPGALPTPPRKPPVPSGKVPGRGGLPTAFTRTQIVDHPVKDADGEYSIEDVTAAVKADERFTDYIVEEIKRDSENGVWKAKLVLAE